MSYVGMAANIVGGELSGWASVLAKRAMWDQYKDELVRQQGYKNEAQGITNQAIQQGSAGEANKQLAQGAGEREQLYKQVGSTPSQTFTPPYQQSASTGRDQAWSNMRGQTRANLGAYGDWALHNTLNDIQNKEALRQVIDFAGGQSRNVYPYEAYEAQHSQDTMSMIGSAISSIAGGAADYAKFAQPPQQQQGQGAFGSAYGSGLSPVPAGTSYNPYTDQNMYAPLNTSSVLSF